MIIIICLGLLLNVIEYFKHNDVENELNFFEIFMKFLSEICLSLIIVIAKYNMEKTYCSPYEICILSGTIGLILYIIVLLVLNKLESKIYGIQYPDNFYELFDNYDIYDFLVFLSSTISNAFYNIVIFVNCNYFTPCHILITSIIKEIYNNLNTDGNISLNFLTFFILILIALMFLVFIEIIEINFFNVSYNTKRNIELRSLSDFDITLNNIQAPQEDLLMGGDVVSISDNN